MSGICSKILTVCSVIHIKVFPEGSKQQPFQHQCIRWIIQPIRQRILDLLQSLFLFWTLLFESFGRWAGIAHPCEEYCLQNQSSILDITPHFSLLYKGCLDTPLTVVVATPAWTRRCDARFPPWRRLVLRWGRGRDLRWGRGQRPLCWQPSLSLTCQATAPVTHPLRKQAGRAPLRVRQLRGHLGTHEAGSWGQQQAEPTVPVASDSDHDCLTCQPSLCGHHGVCSLHASATKGWRTTLLEQPGTLDLPAFWSRTFLLWVSRQWGGHQLFASALRGTVSRHRSEPLPQAGDC